MRARQLFVASIAMALVGCGQSNQIASFDECVSVAGEKATQVEDFEAEKAKCKASFELKKSGPLEIVTTKKNVGVTDWTMDEFRLKNNTSDIVTRALVDASDGEAQLVDVWIEPGEAVVIPDTYDYPDEFFGAFEDGKVSAKFLRVIPTND